MHWSSLSEFIHMGGYGLYVWGSYGVTLVLLGGEVVMLLKRRRSKAVAAVQREQFEPQDSKLETAL
jgi:heme exporter protein D